MRISSELLKILVCPVTKEKLIFDDETQELVSPAAELAFPIVDGIPMMLVGEAKAVGKERIKKLLAQQENSLEKETN